MSTTRFDEAIAVRPGGAPDRVVGEVGEAWSAPTGPNGGYLAAIVVRAIEAIANPDDALRLRSLTLQYLRSAALGPIEVRVEVLRRGRRIANARVSAVQGDREVLTGVAALSVPGMPTPVRWGPTSPARGPAPALDAPLVPIPRYRPGRGAWIEPAPQMPPIFHEVRIAPELGGVPLSGRVPEPGGAVESGGWFALPEARPVDPALVALAIDIWWPPVFEAASRPVIAPTIDLTIHFREDLPAAGIPGGPLFGTYRSTTAAEGLVEEDARVFHEDGRLLAHGRQLALLAAVG